MSKGAPTQTRVYPSRTTSLGRKRAHPSSPQSTRKDTIASSAPRADTDLPPAASYSYIRDVTGLGITTPPPARIRPSSPDFGLEPPLSPRGDTTAAPTFSDPVKCEPLLALTIPVHPSPRPKEATPPTSSSKGENGALESATEDGQSSVASSLLNFRTSTDSHATVSTMPTTPGRRVSITSEFSRSLSFQSPFASYHSTPAPSRSPSPPAGKRATKDSDTEANGVPEATSTSLLRKRPSFRRKKSTRSAPDPSAESEKSQSSDDQSERRASRRSGLLRRASSRSSARPTKESISENEAPGPLRDSTPAVPPLPKSFSTDRLPGLRAQGLANGRSTPVPRLLPSDRALGGNVVARKKDELWSVFRALDADFAKFNSKSLAHKAGVVRSSLLPFLRTYASHPSNRSLRPEDLDRRANILNKWWTGLVELLHGRNNQSISGTDRPVILDGISGILERPEWRTSPSPYCPLDRRLQDGLSYANRSKSSLASSTSDFLAETVHQNVRNIFVQNLSAQMAFVVDKMSLRNASASLVTFCGKACAYAFMFVPGMAEVLVRLWDVPIEPLRRVVQGCGIGKFEDISSDAEHIISAFPPALQQLGFSSLPKYIRKLRTPPQLPPGTANIEWWGRWLERWSGRESDLFYVFVKHFHILVTDFMPLDTSRRERISAPGMLLVHAKILVNLDATIHRHSNAGAPDAAPAYADMLGDPDAIATPLPIPPTNAIRVMAENRLIMLIRDFLSERTVDHPIARQLFAESFNDLLHVCTTGTSLFDHSACYTLLDFLEEALVILARFDRANEHRRSVLGLEFWKDAWKKMISSQNTMTEIRLYSFLYTIWNTVICESGWKADVCFDLLLAPEIFERTFSHWCPMVRAYFMRLLCWRVARHDGDYSSVDVDIFETLVERLGEIWSHHLFLRGLNELQDTVPVATNPCHPFPSRRLLIVRTDTAVSPGGTFLPFDRLFPKDAPSSPGPGVKRSSTVSDADTTVSRPGSALSSVVSDPDSEEQRGRSLGTFLRNLMPSKSRSKSRNASRPESRVGSSPPPALPTGLVRSATDDAPAQRSSGIEAGARPATEVVPALRKFSFKFSLEFHPNAKPLPPMRLTAPRVPQSTQQFLLTYSNKANTPKPALASEPTGEQRVHAKYSGHALAEWALVLGECQSFFDRRKSEGLPSNKFVETPTLAVEVLRRPG
ncbi:hypothetical protein BDY17DRAFT_290066 [Neohortaea acidophila]|uniref:DUF1765-domain-containing protein n=1 Tax=Neohortaea acidophila TaxID=245834 RepID=A0A6A6Q7R9_9PEZI|nr:uncharacterized protein BDY17DRAFT_290066 [Neohortaea acidophila]KAF2487986.1 hypothetical protein BDY17DRAFT_290066 [Neohortaea acidophila]